MPFTNDEVVVLKKLGIEPNIESWNDDDYVQAEETVGDAWNNEVVNSNSYTTEYGLLCKSIIDKITAM